MNSFGFSLKGLLLLVTYAAVAAAGVRYASGATGTVGIVVSYALIPLAVGLAVWGRTESRAFWVGFAEFAIVFALLVGFGMLDMTSREFRDGPIGQRLVWLFERVNMQQVELIPWERAEEYGVPAELIPAPEMRTSVLPADYTVGSGSPEWVLADGTVIRAPRVLDYDGGIPISVRDDGTVIRAPRITTPQPQPPYVISMRNSSSRSDFFRVCQAIACVLVGLIGGFLSQAKRAALLSGLSAANPNREGAASSAANPLD